MSLRIGEALNAAGGARPTARPDEGSSMAESSNPTNGAAQDTNNQRLTNLLLNGVNYLPWSLAVTTALGERSRLGHVTGRTQAPATSDPNFDKWQANDHNVMSWIFSSMEPQIYEIFAYMDTAKNLWDSLYEMYGQANNASRVFKLQQGLVSSKQGMNQSFIEHLSKMKKLWEELRQYRPITPDVRDYIQREEQDRIFQLLASLKPEFEETKRDILMRPKLPSFKTVCSIIQNEETRKRFMVANSKVKAFVDSPENLAYYTMSNFKQSDASSRWAKEKGKKPIRSYCDHCNRDGHSRERCWVLNPQLRPVWQRERS